MDSFIGGCVALLYWCFIDLIGSFIARIAIPLLSVGRVHVQPLGSSSTQLNWLGCRRDGSGRIVVADDVAGYLGLVISLIALLGLWLIGRAVF